jgi:hypothetical protein
MDAAEAEQPVAQAASMDAPTANSTVITYQIDGRVVYLTNERPLPGYHSEPADNLFAWIPGVKEPGDAERDLLDRVVTAHLEGGKDALEREARKLEAGREPPPPIEAASIDALLQVPHRSQAICDRRVDAYVGFEHIVGGADGEVLVHSLSHLEQALRLEIDEVDVLARVDVLVEQELTGMRVRLDVAGVRPPPVVHRDLDRGVRE